MHTPAGQYVLAWEQQHLDRAVADIFGFHAVQLGLPQLDALRANRMPHRWVASREGAAQVQLCCEFDALPFDSQSLDLIVLPHALERAEDPHLALAEVERVLRPEGRVVILGFNPVSLWAMRRQRPWPASHELIGYRRIRDWLRLLSFEVEAGRFGCYRPPVRAERWLERLTWMERAGDRWWPVFGAVYALTAIKRVRGMRLVGLARQKRVTPKAAPSVVANQQHLEVLEEH